MNALEAVRLAADLASLAAKVPDAIERVREFIETGADVAGDVLLELPDLSRNHIEQARIERLAAGGTGGA